MSDADVVEKSKGLQWMYIPAFIGKILNQLMEDDDEVDAGKAFWVKELGIRVLVNDDDAMERGELEKVIKESRSSIIVFLKDYASSRRCLDELVMILECKRNFKHVILPVFYGMDPPQVRKQTGSVVEAFAGHEAQFEVEIDERNRKLGMKKVKGWREALGQVVDLGGLVLQNQVDE
ncbi:toll/interleukin-1 receptor-like protein [Camellia sinensis]|uniref:toll/interleukin-1 receptor-like protein n=1 Tax=Camellia sinensis TaxID=4442 RepID=UPI001035B23A|nr:toll/interleukin-1 receptor-like protein [Camellia sinensis]